jgi:uncharacterized membrane protein
VTGPRSRRERRTVPDAGRLITFLDAAVAIALTLLVLPLAELVPEGVRAGETPTEIVTGNLSSLGSFLLSFWVIWRFWTIHHRLFAWSGPIGPGLLRLNLVWLLSIVLLPFVTEMVASYSTEPFVVRVYTGLLLVTSASLTAMTALMRRTARGAVFAPDAEDGPPLVFLLSSLAATLGIVVAFLLVLFVPVVGYWALLVLAADPLTAPLVARLQRRLTDRPVPRASPNG